MKASRRQYAASKKTIRATATVGVVATVVEGYVASAVVEAIDDPDTMLGRHMATMLDAAKEEADVLRPLRPAAAQAGASIIPTGTAGFHWKSPVPEIGTPGSENGGRKRAYGFRTAARYESAGRATDPLPVTRLPSTLLNPARITSGAMASSHGAQSMIITYHQVYFSAR